MVYCVHMHTVCLTAEERTQLRTMLRKGEGKARVLNRARIIIKLDQGGSDDRIAADTFVSTKTIGRIRERFTEGGLDRALYDLPRSGQPPIITAKVEAHLVAIACTTPPDGRAHWTLELLRTKLIDDKKVKHISTVAILKRLTKRGIKPWREKNVVHSESHARVHRAHGAPA